VVDLDRVGDPARIVHRRQHVARLGTDGVLRWQWADILAEVERGLDLALRDGPLASIGVDTWGVDYGLLDQHGRLIAPPVSHRDERIQTWQATADRLGRDRLYAITGIQLMPINTVFQLAAHDRQELDRASTLLMLPELVVHHLTGHVTGERTSAGTTALVDVSTGTWSTELVTELELPYDLFPEIVPPGTAVGMYRDTPVHLVAGHDTASAFLAVSGPTGPSTVTISAGTWVLVGAELAAPDTSAEAAAANLSNEPAAFGGVRLLRNVTGLWLIEQCRASWGDPPITELLDQASTASAQDAQPIDPNHPTLIAPPDMPAAIRALAGLPDDAPRGGIVRVALAAISAGAADVIEVLSRRVGAAITDAHLIGGGARNTLLAQMIEADAGVRIHPGATEATAVGNAMVQGLALGLWKDIDAARFELARSSAIKDATTP